MKVHFVPTLKDNYSYILVDEARRSALLIDPAEADPVIAALEEHALTPSAIWITHHHSDHIGGIPGLLARYGALPIICSTRDKDRVTNTQTVSEGDRLEFAGEPVEVLLLPGHAEGHIAYHFPQSHHLFAGDVLFGASCGGVPGGAYDEMFESVSRVGKLPAGTKIWCGHEYTKNNLRWAEAVLGESALAERKQNQAVPSVPLLLETELATNPFLRLESPEVLAFTGKSQPREVFKALRQAKDRF